MKLSVLIPTHGRPDKLARCLEALANQSNDADFQLIVGLDGATSATPDPAIPQRLADRTQIMRLPRLGLIGVRHAMLREAVGDVVLWLNDDGYPQPGLVRAHLTMHEADAPRVVVGQVRWADVASPNLFDAMVQQTDLLFFAQPHPPDTPRVRVGFRDCFGLNLSFPRALALSTQQTLSDAAHGGAPVAEPYGYEDLELAYRLEQAGAELWRTQDAVVEHDHRHTPTDVLRREVQLGRAAWAWTQRHPAFSHAVFRRDLRDPDVLAYLRQSLQHERGDAARIERSFLALAQLPIDAASPALLPVLAEHWVLLKRYLWRRGLLDAADGVAPRWSLLNG